MLFWSGPVLHGYQLGPALEVSVLWGLGGWGGCRGGCSVEGEPLDRKLPSLPLLEALRASCGRAATATTEDWPAAVEFPPSNNFYKPPGS